jgi:hypothetical protein
MRATIVDIRNDCEFQHNNVVHRHAIILNFFWRSLRTKGPLLSNHLSLFPSSNATAHRKFLRPCELRFPENKVNVPDVCWPAKRDSNDLWAGLSGAPAGFAVGIKDVLYGRVVGFRGHTNSGDCLNAKPFIAGRSTRVLVVYENRFPHCCSLACRDRRPILNLFLRYVDAANRLRCTRLVRTSSV